MSKDMEGTFPEYCISVNCPMLALIGEENQVVPGKKLIKFIQYIRLLESGAVSKGWSIEDLDAVLSMSGDKLYIGCLLKVAGRTFGEIPINCPLKNASTE